MKLSAPQVLKALNTIQDQIDNLRSIMADVGIEDTVSLTFTFDSNKMAAALAKNIARKLSSKPYSRELDEATVTFTDLEPEWAEFINDQVAAGVKNGKLSTPLEWEAGESIEDLIQQVVDLKLTTKAKAKKMDLEELQELLADVEEDEEAEDEEWETDSLIDQVVELKLASRAKANKMSLEELQELLADVEEDEEDQDEWSAAFDQVVEAGLATRAKAKKMDLEELQELLADVEDVEDEEEEYSALQNLLYELDSLKAQRGSTAERNELLAKLNEQDEANGLTKGPKARLRELKSVMDLSAGVDETTEELFEEAKASV